jgi:Zn-dependent peptidase ImmA (M78 family)/transcriptional regulator with XRE-family HTH domain
MPKQDALVRPELLLWARQEAGLTVEQAARKIPVKPERLIACEQGSARLTVNQLRSLSNAYKRPLALFFLPQPPPHSANLRDFRRSPEQPEVSESPALRYEIRRARYRRQVSLELFEELGEQPPTFIRTTAITENPEAVATQVRELLGITRDEQHAFSGEYEALNRWRNAVEESGVMVFQAGGIEHGEMRGFSISETVLPVIVMNSKDAPQSRIFTMIHELAHIMLRAGGLCNLDEVQDIEVFCNRVAGATLVPQAWLISEPTVGSRGPRPTWDEPLIRMLARRYRVSREVIVRRLAISGYATQAFYQRKRAEYQQEFESRDDQTGFTRPDVKAISQAGRMFVRLVLESYHQEKITTSDVSDYLEVRVKHLGNIERAVQNPTLERGAA